MFESLLRGGEKKGSDLRLLYLVMIIHIIDRRVSNFLRFYILANDSIDYWPLFGTLGTLLVGVKITKGTFTLCDKVEEKNTPRPSSSTPGSIPQRILTHEHHETGLVKAALAWGQNKAKTKTKIWKPPKFHQQKNESINCALFTGQNATRWRKRINCCAHSVNHLSTIMGREKSRG